jgi:catechol 2,3-dioxygenase-like lactoylglutathione lyase family enzyme
MSSDTPERPPFRATGIDHVVLRVADLERSIGFYRDVLGCAVERRLDELGLVQLRAGHSLIDLVDVDAPLGRSGGAAPGAQARNMDHVAIAIDDFDECAIRAHLERHAVDADETKRLYGAEGFGPSIYLRDPDDNRVELKGPPAPEGD